MSGTNKQLANEIANLLEEVDDEYLNELNEEEILELRKKLNPYGRTIEGSDKYLNFSITQISHEYWKKFIISAMVGFLNRMNDEWKVPEGLPVISVYEYLEDPSKLDTPKNVLEKGHQRIINDYEFNREWMKKRVIVKEFLEEMFQFNPQEHVRSAYRPCRSDPERAPINTPAGKLAVEHLKKTDSEFKSKEELYEDVQNTTSKTQSDMQPIRDTQHTTSTTGKDKTVSYTTREFLPPHDMFGRFTLYYKENYEQLRDFVKDAYAEKPDLELAINPYAVHDTEEEAEAFKKKHRNEVIAEIFTAHTGKWCFFDSFKKQRENVNFYNDNTIILEEMIKQLERDERLGQDLMKKRVAKAKRRNVLLDGKDAESFKKWREQNSTIKNLKAEYLGDTVDDECPSDAIQVDVWKVNKTGDELIKDRFYTKAEAPVLPE